jgi:hypothetical protein
MLFWPCKHAFNPDTESVKLTLCFADCECIVFVCASISRKVAYVEHGACFRAGDLLPLQCKQAMRTMPFPP